MRNILARGGIEFLAVLLGITSSLWIDNNKKLADIESERIVVHQILSDEIESIIDYTSERIEYYNKQDSTIDYLYNNWENFNSQMIDDPFQFTYDIFTTGTYMFSPNLSTFDALKSDGRFNLIDIDIRKNFGELFMLLEYINKIETNENQAREVLLEYLSKNHSEIQYKYPYQQAGANAKFENYLVVLEKTKDDKTVWALLGRKCGLTKSRNSRVEWFMEILASIQGDLKSTMRG